MEDIVGLYRRAFAEFGVRALWNIREFEEPTVANKYWPSPASSGPKAT